VKANGTIFAVVYRRIVPRLGHAQAIGAIEQPGMIGDFRPWLVAGA
jgi:hypothetical protein